MKLDLQKFNLPTEQNEEIEAEIETIERQSKSPKPKTEIISIALKSIEVLLGGIVAGVAANLSTPFVQGWIQKTQLLLEALQHSH